MPNVTILSTNFLEPWDYTNPDGQGIGGSETAAIELAWRMAKMGHDVISYAPVPWSGERVWRDSLWAHFRYCDFKRPGIWILFRNPDMLDCFKEEHPDQALLLSAQDTYYPTATKERYAKLDRYICLCRDHADNVASMWPCLDGKIVISRNGIKSEALQTILDEEAPRNPKKIIYCSSPDRGLKNAAIVFGRAREYRPDLELHAFYGWNNVETGIMQNGEGAKYYWGRLKDDVDFFTKDKPGIILHGRVPQPELHRHMATAGIWLYPTIFSETGCITNMECQALGAIPITNPIWALRDYCEAGFHIQGDVDRDALVRQRYVGELLRLTSDEGIRFQEAIREKMIPQALERFSWDGVAKQLVEVGEAVLSNKEVSLHASVR